MKKNYYISGDWNLICDVCGKKIKASDSKHRWDGFVVCPEDFEQRHPQDFVRAKQDKISVPFTRPRPTDAFILRYLLSDSVMVTDSEMGGDYLVNLSDYFLEDYMQDYSPFKIEMDWNRSFDDSANILEEMSKQISKPFADTVLISEMIFPRKTISRSFEDTVTVSETGSIFWENYIDSTYFAEQYVGTTIDLIP